MNILASVNIGTFLIILTIWTIEELSIAKNNRDRLGAVWTVSFITLVLWSAYYLGGTYMNLPKT